AVRRLVLGLVRASISVHFPTGPQCCVTMFQRPGPLWKAIGKLGHTMPVLPRPWSTKLNRSLIFSRVLRQTLKGLLADSVGAPECPLSGVADMGPCTAHVRF